MKVSICKLILKKEKEINYVSLNNPKTIYKFSKDILKLNEEPEEVAYLICLDSNNNCICCEVSHGGLNYASLNPRDVYKRALISNCKSIIIAHNHPSGNIKPSREDIEITEILKNAGEILDIKLLDHIIVGNKDYYSFYENSPEYLSISTNNIIYHKSKKDVERSL